MASHLHQSLGGGSDDEDLGPQMGNVTWASWACAGTTKVGFCCFKGGGGAIGVCRRSWARMTYLGHNT